MSNPITVDEFDSLLLNDRSLPSIIDWMVGSIIGCTQFSEDSTETHVIKGDEETDKLKAEGGMFYVASVAFGGWVVFGRMWNALLHRCEEASIELDTSRGNKEDIMERVVVLPVGQEDGMSVVFRHTNRNISVAKALLYVCGKLTIEPSTTSRVRKNPGPCSC